MNGCLMDQFPLFTKIIYLDPFNKPCFLRRRAFLDRENVVNVDKTGSMNERSLEDAVRP